MALVLDVIRRSASSGSILKPPRTLSHSTGFAPKYVTTSAVAVNVYVGTSTSSSLVRPIASSANCRAEVPEFTAKACLQPMYWANSFSNSWVTGPVVNQLERRTFTTAVISSSPIAGRWKGIYGCAVIGFSQSLEVLAKLGRSCFVRVLVIIVTILVVTILGRIKVSRV